MTTSAPKRSSKPPGTSCSTRCPPRAETAAFCWASPTTSCCSMAFRSKPDRPSAVSRTLLTTAGLASLHFSKRSPIEDFTRLVRAFTVGGSKAQDVSKQIKETLGDGQADQHHQDQRSEVRGGRSLDRRREHCGADRGADAGTGIQAVVERSAEAAAVDCRGGRRKRRWRRRERRQGAARPMVPLGSVPNGLRGSGREGVPKARPSGHRAAQPRVRLQHGQAASFPCRKQEVIQAIRLLTRFGEVQQRSVSSSPRNCRRN